jgi:predicted SpoU family rRNA methylase
VAAHVVNSHGKIVVAAKARIVIVVPERVTGSAYEYYDYRTAPGTMPGLEAQPRRGCYEYEIKRDSVAHPKG